MSVDQPDADAVDPRWWREVADQADPDEDEPAVRYALRFREAAEASVGSKAEILMLLSRATSPMLNPEDWNSPYSPMISFGDGRSALPEDFSEEDLALLSAVARMFTDEDSPTLRAQVQDIAWTYGDRSDTWLLEAAIDSYMAAPLNSDSWYRGGQQRWRRALELSKRRGRAGHAVLSKMSGELVGILMRSAVADGYFAVQVSAMLADNRLLPKSEFEVTARHCEVVAWQACEAGSLELERAWWRQAHTWHIKAGEREDALLARSYEAESLISEADRLRGDSARAMVAADRCETALKILSDLPGSFRRRHHLDERIDALRLQLREDRELVVESMSVLEGEPMDITELVNTAQSRVSGLDLRTALLRLSSLERLASRTADIEAATEQLMQHPLSSMFASTTFSAEGQKVSTRPGANLSQAPSVDGALDPAVWGIAVRNHMIRIGLVVDGLILPAMNQVTMQHRVTREALYGICQDSPHVPPRHEHAWAFGLLHGLNYDFISATSVLVPQIENLVRRQLKAAGSHTMFVDADGVETEKGLTSLLKDENALAVFGDDWVYELQLMLVDPQGPNLRNTTAHGLDVDGSLGGQAGVYVWWLALRLAMLHHGDTLPEGKRASIAQPL